jgi:hypothetical protein
MNEKTILPVYGIGMFCLSCDLLRLVITIVFLWRGFMAQLFSCFFFV